MVLTRSPFPTATLPAPIDVQRTEDGYRFEAALPGFKPEEVEVTLDQGTLTISAKRSEQKTTERGRYLRREVFSGSYQRRVALPPEVGADDVHAAFENGILTLDVHYETGAGAVKIPVGAALPETTQTTDQAEQPAA
jgi:HSP20 family protein